MSFALTRLRALGLVKMPHLWVVFDVSRVKRDRLEIQLAIQVHSRHNIPTSARKPSVSTLNRASKAVSKSFKMEDIPPSILPRSCPFRPHASRFPRNFRLEFNVLQHRHDSTRVHAPIHRVILRFDDRVEVFLFSIFSLGLHVCRLSVRPRVSSAASARARVSHAPLSLGSRLGGTGSGSVDARRGVRAATRESAVSNARGLKDAGVHVYTVRQRIVNE